MPVKTKFSLKGPMRDSYLDLVSAFPLASIKSDEHLQTAQKVMDELLAKGKLGDGEEMCLDALSDLLAAYEDEHHAIEPASDAEMLLHLMEAKNVTQAQLSRDTTIPKSTISEVLAGKKPLSRQLIRNLASYFNVGRECAGRQLLIGVGSLSTIENTNKTAGRKNLSHGLQWRRDAGGGAPLPRRVLRQPGQRRTGFVGKPGTGSAAGEDGQHVAGFGRADALQHLHRAAGLQLRAGLDIAQ